MDKAKKRLIILFSVLGAVVLLIVLSSFAFALQQAEVRFYNEDGTPATVPSELTSDVLIAAYKGDSIFTLDEKGLGESINSNFTDYYAINIVRSFPNKVVIHLAERKGVFFLNKDNTKYEVDITGWVIREVDRNSSLIDISNFANLIDSAEQGKVLTWLTGDAQENFTRLQTVVKTVWRFNYNYGEMTRIISKFAFDDNMLTITTATGSRIIIQGANTDLESKVQKSIGVYYNQIINTTMPEVTITVDENGNVKTN